MRRLVGTTFSLIGWLGWVACGFGGLGVCLRILYDVSGAWGAAAGFLLGPLTFAATPWYALFALGTWTPVLLCYVGGFVSTAMIGFGAGLRY
jgi:hypothetical protein